MNGSQNAQGSPATHPPTYNPFPPGPPSTDPRRKSPALASVLSLMPGLGQVYVGYYKMGFIHAIVVATVITLLANISENLIPFFGIFLFFFYLYNIVDAGRRATLYNQALGGMASFELPTDIELPSGAQGSLVGGAILIVASLIVLSNTLFDIPLWWLEDWWPVGPLLFGLYLFSKSLLERKSTKAES